MTKPLTICALALAANSFAQNPFDDPDFGKQKVGLFDGSYAQCILKEMPGVANDATAQQINTACLRRYPAGLNTDEGGSSLFGYESGPECAAKKGKATASRVGGARINAACHKLYEPVRAPVAQRTYTAPPVVELTPPPTPSSTSGFAVRQPEPAPYVAQSPDPPRASISRTPVRPEPPVIPPCVIKPVMSDIDRERCRQ